MQFIAVQKIGIARRARAAYRRVGAEHGQERDQARPSPPGGWRIDRISEYIHCRRSARLSSLAVNAMPVSENDSGFVTRITVSMSMDGNMPQVTAPNDGCDDTGGPRP